MPVDLNLLQRFADAITSDSVTLPVAGAQPITVTKAYLNEVMDELDERRRAEAEQAEGLEYVQGVTENLTEYVQALIAAGQEPTLDQLVAILNQGAEEEEEEPEPDGLVQTVQAGLAAIGVPGATPDTASALLQLIAAYQSQGQPGQHAAPEPPPAQRLLQAPQNVPPAAPAMNPPRVVTRLQPAQHSDADHTGRVAPLHPNGMPVPAHPGPFVPVSLDQLDPSVRRGRNGRWESGNLAGSDE